MNIDISELIRRLPEQRWFGRKSASIERAELFDHGLIDDGPPALALALVEVTYGDGETDLFQLPLLIEPDGSARDALEDVERLRVFGELMAQGSSIKGDRGVFEFNGPGLNPSEPPGARGARPIGAEQSNSSFVLDEEVIVKLYRRVAPGSNPDLELVRFLTTEGYANVPPHLGEITYEYDDGEERRSIDVGLAQRFLPGAIDGWEHTLAKLHELYDAVDEADVTEDFGFLTEERAGVLLNQIEELGEVTGALHVMLAHEATDPELSPETVDEFDLREWTERAKLSARRLLDDGVAELEPLTRKMTERLDHLREVQEPGLRTRVHGDYHLGQVVLTPRGWMVLDFEGEPARTLDQRREKQSPLRDVAGMLRSFSYVATAALFQRCDPDTPEWKRLAPWAATWERLARDRFLQAYLTRSHEGRFLPSDRDEIAVMLDVFEIDKALYELGYERGHRPEWVRIPLRGITQILEGD